MDGHFVPNIVMGAAFIDSVHKAVPDIYMDCHMMVSEPLKVRARCLVSPTNALTVDPAYC